MRIFELFHNAYITVTLHGREPVIPPHNGPEQEVAHVGEASGHNKETARISQQSDSAIKLHAAAAPDSEIHKRHECTINRHPEDVHCFHDLPHGDFGQNGKPTAPHPYREVLEHLDGAQKSNTCSAVRRQSHHVRQLRPRSYTCWCTVVNSITGHAHTSSMSSYCAEFTLNASRALLTTTFVHPKIIHSSATCSVTCKDQNVIQTQLGTAVRCWHTSSKFCTLYKYDQSGK